VSSMTTTPDADAPDLARTTRAVVLGIATAATLLAVPSFYIAGSKFGVAVLIGGAIGVANFLVLARVVGALTGGRSAATFWGVVYFFKILVLFGGLYLLFSSGWLNIYGLLVGLSAIVPGIVVGGVLALPKAAPPR
jgi:hypothetical protein